MRNWIAMVLGAVAMAMLVIPATPALADAAELWKKNCTKCHGENGNGDTKMGKKLKVADYTKAEVQDKMKDDEMEKAITEGKGEKDAEGETPMPAFGKKLKPEEIKELVKHVRSFKK